MKATLEGNYLLGVSRLVVALQLRGIANNIHGGIMKHDSFPALFFQIIFGHPVRQTGALNFAVGKSVFQTFYQLYVGHDKTAHA